MRRTFLWCPLLLIVLSAVWADDQNKGDKKPDDKSRTPAEQYRALKEGIDALEKQVMGRFMASKSEEEKQTIINEYIQQNRKYYPRMLALGEKNPKESFALDALLWVFGAARSGPEADRAVELLVRDHI